MACINPNSPEFKAALQRIGNPLLAEIEVDAMAQVKPGVAELFDSNPELASIGTAEQYSQYLNSIFPDSKVKDIVYHGTDKEFKNFKTFVESNVEGVFYTYSKESAKIFGKAMPVLANSTKPLIEEDSTLYDSISKEAKENLIKNYDSVITPNEMGVVFEPEQIHILGNKQDIEGFKNFVEKTGGQPMFQMKGTEVKKASPKTIAIVKDFLKRIGVNYESVKGIVHNGIKYDANAIANIMQKLVQVVEGKEDVALPEEAMHFAVEILEQTNPKLFNQLLKEINGYNTLKEVFAAYGTNPLYQTKDGKPDVLKIKKEAIGKVLAEAVINRAENLSEKPENVSKIHEWWNKIVEFLKNLFFKSGFDTAAMKILSGEAIGTVDDIRAQEANVFLQKSTQSGLYDKLKLIKSQIEKKDDGYYINGVKVPRRVSDIVKTWYDRKFSERKLTNTEYQNAVDDLKAETGTKGHKWLEDIFDVFIDENGYIREKENDDPAYVSTLSEDERNVYDILKNNLRERVHSFPKENGGTRFLSEITIYDQSRGLAGTIDFVAIEPDGKVNVLDWKFMDLNVEKYEDVPWYKVNAWNMQMEQYVLMLEKVYGVSAQDFKQTRMIPIKTYYTRGNAKRNILPRLSKIEIGAVNVKDIEEDYLVPVGLETEKTGIKKVDDLLEKMNSLYKILSERKVDEENKSEKARQLNALFTAIRQLKMRQNIVPLLSQAKILNTDIKKLIQQYKDNWEGKDATTFRQEDISAFYDEILIAQKAISYYATLSSSLKFAFSEEMDDEAKKLKEDVRDTTEDARDLEEQLFDLGNDFTTEFIAKSERVDDYFKPEKIVKGISRWLSSTSTIQLKGMEVLFKKANRALGFAAMDTISETKKLQNLEKEFRKWATAKGLTNKNFFSYIKKQGKNELIDEYNPEFYSELKSATSKDAVDFTWIRENIDIVEYKKHLSELLNKKIENVKNRTVVLTEEDAERVKNGELPLEIEREISKLKRLYDTSTSTSVGWLLYDELKKFPRKDKWESEEWKRINLPENKPALDFYNYIRERNDYYKSINYISAKQARVFLPFVRKGLMEKLVLGGKISIGEQFLRAISIDEGDIGYGKTDPFTGRPVDTIPTYFTNEIEGEISEDLFRNMALYNEMAIKYKYLSDIEAQARALVNTERNKKAIATSVFGKTVYKNGVLQYTPDNNSNVELIEDMVKAIVYGQKYVSNESFDQVLGTLGGFGKKINDKLGMKIFPEDLEGRQITLNKLIDRLNTTFQLNALGLNPLPAVSNLFGGSFQSIINAGTYFTREDFTATELWLLGTKMAGGESKKKMIAALEYFLPLTDNYNKEIAKTLSLSKLSQENVQEFLMVLMRNADMFVQTANFYTFLKNTIVENGEVVNVREYLRTQPEYVDMFAGTQQDREARRKKFEQDVKKLIEERGVLKLAEYKDGELTIPGVERKSQSVIELRRKVQQLNKDALGNLSEDDLRLINLNIYGKSFMLFKNWIPRPVDVRMGNLKYNSSYDAYEWGRMRMVFRVITEDTYKSLGTLKDILVGNDEGVSSMRRIFEKKKKDYEEETGKTLNMTESQFMDLMTKNVKAQLVDAIFMLSLLALYLGLKALPDDDEEDERVKNQYRFMLRAVDKIKDELAYFYNPGNLLSLVSAGGLFPSMSYLDNFRKLLQNFMIENYAIAIGDEKLEKETKVIKYVMKSFPAVNQVSSWLPMFYPELSKELGIRIQSQARPIGK